MTGEENDDVTASDRELEGLVDGNQDLIVLSNDLQLRTHGPNQCWSEYCCIHSPSDHPLRTAPMIWEHQMQLMFRICEHEKMHPDPDALAHHQMLSFTGQRVPYDGWHPCCPDRCCIAPEQRR